MPQGIHVKDAIRRSKDAQDWNGRVFGRFNSSY